MRPDQQPPADEQQHPPPAIPNADLPCSRAWYVAKLVLTSFSVACGAIVLGLSVSLAVDPAVQSYIAVWSAPQAGAAVLWSGAELVALFFRAVRARRPSSDEAPAAAEGGRRPSGGIHPGAHVAVQLLLSLGFAAGTGLTAYLHAFALSFMEPGARDAYPGYWDYYYNDEGSGGDGGYYSKSYVDAVAVLVAFLTLLTITHLVLFVRSCAETAQRERAKTLTLVRAPPPQVQQGLLLPAGSADEVKPDKERV
ncbi:hypothetical protein GGS23DRAFT_610133 [Durotheca rogersii]|uniref:uncharacterized protein n=1 Tax=Durotheca rogersii TaxID=419775 RepID=UPI00221ED0C6|nr:uncharacterized protein GGS23DRAFT_610133 [Durotheca rogersii]KAI5862485.1 hypothetical protein GGS23DRAFT_610133 [Durotheca rogersii]